MSYFANECFVCKSADSLKICSRCNMISYCGSNHQKIDWAKHKDFCNAISFIMNEKGVSHVYEKLRNSDSDTWCKERDRMCSLVKSGLDRPLYLHEEQMLLMPRSCFVCHDTRQELLTTCPVCFCVNFCEKHPSDSQHDKDCQSLKLFHDLDVKIQDPVKLRIVLALIDQIVESTKFESSSDVPNSMKEYLDKKITSGDYVLKQACASNMLSMSLTVFNAVKKLNLQSLSEMLFHIRCDFPDNVVWELLLHFLPNLNFLKIVFVEQLETRTLKIKLCDDCCAKNKRLILQTKEVAYKNYIKDELYKKPDILAYFHAEISKLEDEFEWRDLLEDLSRIGCPLLLTSVTESKLKIVSESLRTTFWPGSICFEGFNDFGALYPLRKWTNGGIEKINQYMIITENQISQCKAGILSNGSPLLLKKEAGNSWDPQHFFYAHICRTCRTETVSVTCKYCNMVFYCSELHRREDWYKHKDLCKVIQKLLTESGLKNIFDGELDLMGSKKTNPDSWLQAKLNVLSKVESQLGRKFFVFEQQMFLFPKTCFACHEGDLSKLRTCKCGTIFCKIHKDSRSHKSLCEDFYLSLLLIENKQLLDSLPEFTFVSGLKKAFPDSMQDFLKLQLSFINEADVTNVQKIVVAELLTNTLTLLWAMKKLAKFEDNFTIVVHIIESKNAENAIDEFWEVFFHWMPNLTKLIIIFLGSQTKALNLIRSYLIGHELKERDLSMKSYPLKYEQFVQSSFFVKPDIIVGFNLDIHECKLRTLNCSCRKDILTVKKLNVPFVMTSGTKERARKDHKRLSEILETSISPNFSYLNPFASLEPVRDFETEGLRYSNKYVLIYSEWTQVPSDKNEIFVEQVPDSIRSSELEKKLSEILFTKSKLQPAENFDSKRKQKGNEDRLPDEKVSKVEKKLEESKNAIETSKLKEKEVSNSKSTFSSVLSANSELKLILRNLRSESKTSLENMESKTKNEISLDKASGDVQDSKLEQLFDIEIANFEMEAIEAGKTNLQVNNASAIEIPRQESTKNEQDEDLEEKCREVFQSLLEEVKIEKEGEKIENLGYETVAKVDNPVGDEISEPKKQDEDLKLKLRGKELEEELVKVAIKNETKAVEHSVNETNMKMYNAPEIKISQETISELKKQDEVLEEKLREKELKEELVEFATENEAKTIENFENEANVKVDNASGIEIFQEIIPWPEKPNEDLGDKLRKKQLEKIAIQSKAIEIQESKSNPEIFERNEQHKNLKEILKAWPDGGKNLQEILIPKFQNETTESETKIETDNLDCKKYSEYKNKSSEEIVKSESKLSIENLQQESKSVFEHFDKIESLTEIKSMMKSSTTEDEPKFKVSGRLGQTENTIKLRTENAHSKPLIATDNSKIKREKVSKFRNALSNVSAANSELRCMLKNLRCDSKLTSLENSKSTIKQNEILEEALNVQDSDCKKNIEKDNAPAIKIMQQNISERNGQIKNLEEKLQEVSPVAEKELEVIAIEKEVKPAENSKFKLKRGIKSAESKTPFENEYSEFGTKKVSKSENKFSSVITANSESRFMVTNSRSDSKSCLESFESKTETKENAVFLHETAVVQNSELKKQIVEILTTESEMVSVKNPNYETHVDLDKETEIEIHQTSEKDEHVEKKLLEVLPILEKQLKEIAIGNEVKPVEDLNNEKNVEKNNKSGIEEKLPKMFPISEKKVKEITINEGKPENLEIKSKPRIEGTESETVVETEDLSCKEVPESEITSREEATKSELREQDENLKAKLLEVFPVLKKELKEVMIDEEKPENVKFQSKPRIEDAESGTVVETEDLSCKEVSKSENTTKGEATKLESSKQNKNLKEKLFEVFPVLEKESKEITIDNGKSKNVETESKLRIEDAGSETAIETEDLNYKEFPESEITSRGEATKSELREQDENLKAKFLEVFPVLKKELKEFTIDKEKSKNLETKSKPRIEDPESDTAVETKDLNCKEFPESEITSRGEATKTELSEQDENLIGKLSEVLPVLEKELKEVMIDKGKSKNLETKSKPKIEDAESETAVETEDLRSSEHNKNLKETFFEVFPVLEKESKEITIDNGKSKNVETESKLRIEDAESETAIETEDSNCNEFLESEITSRGEAIKSELREQDENLKAKFLEVFPVLENELKEFTIDKGKSKNLETKSKPRIEDPESDTAVETEDLNCKEFPESEITSRGEATKTELSEQDENLIGKLLEEFPVLKKEFNEIAFKIDTNAVKSSESGLKPGIETANFETAIESGNFNCKKVSECKNIWNAEASKFKPGEQDENLEEKLFKVVTVLEEELKDIKIENRTKPDENLKFKSKLGNEDIDSKISVKTDNLICKKVFESENTSIEEIKKIESEPNKQDKNLEDNEAKSENPESELTPEIKTAIEIEDLNCKKIFEPKNTSREEATKSESRLPVIENLEYESKHGFESLESETENKSTLKSYVIENSKSNLETGPFNEELFKENLLLKEEIKRLKENEECIKSENLRLREEVCRLQKEYNLI